METNQGYVYVMINPSYGEGIVKIGKTTKEPEERAKELSSATGVVTPFIVVYKRAFKNCHTAERMIHEILEDKGCRVNNNREFFAIGISEAINLMLQLPDNDDSYVDNDEDNAAIEGNHDLATEFFNIAQKYHFGSENTFQDYDKALIYYERSADLGNIRALERIGAIWHYEKNNADRALHYLQKATDNGYWRNYQMIADIYGDKDSRLYNIHNQELAWKRYFEGVENNESTIEISEWLNVIGYTIVQYLFDLHYSNRPVPSNVSRLIYRNIQPIKHALKRKIENCNQKGYNSLAESYERHIGLYLDGLEEKLLLSEENGDKLGENYFIIAEKYFYGHDGYDKNEYKALRYFKESDKLGYKKALVYVGIYWLTQSTHRDRVNEAWRKFYNYAYDRVEDESNHPISEDEKLLLTEAFYEMFLYASGRDTTDLLHDYYYMLAANFGILDYMANKMEQLDQLYEEIKDYQGPCAEEATTLSTDELLEDTDKLIKSLQYQTQLAEFNQVFSLIKDFFADFKERNTDPNPRVYRLD